jgi:hypothetical protein
MLCAEINSYRNALFSDPFIEGAIRAALLSIWSAAHGQIESKYGPKQIYKCAAA